MNITSLAEVVSKFKRNWTQVIEREEIERICLELKVSWRERILSPFQTVQLLLLQILHGNTAITHLRMFTERGFSASAYCQARRRLPLDLFERLLEGMSSGLRRAKRNTNRWLGRQVYFVDGSNFSMPDTPALQKHFGQPYGQKKGCGFPVAHFVALFHAGTGMVTKVLSGSLFSHDLSRFIKLHPTLRKEDVVVGDRAFCSYAHLALMARRGVDAVFRLHQQQIVNFRAGRSYTSSKSGKGLPRSRWEKKLGKKDQLVTWFKPKILPPWMNENQYRLLPASLLLRELAYSVQTRGFRTRHVVLVTTLVNSQEFPAEALAELYGQRWNIETNFGHLKTTMGMDVLHCQTVDGVLKEFYTFCLVYNLIRTIMLEAGVAQNKYHSRISFIDTLRWLIVACYRHIPHLPILITPRRPGRIEPRAVKRRPKSYPLLSKPRKMYKLKTLRA